MEKKNYTLDCKWVDEVNSENIKEMAKVMVWNCCTCTYKDDEVTAGASATFGMDGEPYTMNVIIDGKHYNYTLNSKRVSAKMGKEIVDNILKAVAEHKEELKDMKKIISKKDALERAKEFWDNYVNGNYEGLCYEDDGLSWQIYFDDEDETFVICVEGYSEKHSDWHTAKDIAEIIYEFLNR